MAWNSTYQRAKDGVHDDNRKVLEEVLPAQRVPRCVMKCRYEYDYGYEYGTSSAFPRIVYLYRKFKSIICQNEEPKVEKFPGKVQLK